MDTEMHKGDTILNLEKMINDAMCREEAREDEATRKYNEAIARKKASMIESFKDHLMKFFIDQEMLDAMCTCYEFIYQDDVPVQVVGVAQLPEGEYRFLYEGMPRNNGVDCRFMIFAPGQFQLNAGDRSHRLVTSVTINSTTKYEDVRDKFLVALGQLRDRYRQEKSHEEATRRLANGDVAHVSIDYSNCPESEA